LKTASLLFLLLVLVCTQSCKSDNNDENPYNLQSLDDYFEFMEQHEWGCIMSISDETDDKSMMYVEFEAEWTPEEIPETDTFYLSLNGMEVPLEDQLYFEGIDLPQASTIEVVFKRNNEVIIDKSVTVPAFPQITQFPSDPVWTDPITIKWNLANNSHFQLLDLVAWNSSSERYKTFVLSPSARSCIIPKNTITLSNVSDYYVEITEVNFVEQNSAVLATITYGFQESGRSECLTEGKVLTMCKPNLTNKQF
jgi:hypothetical protein